MLADITQRQTEGLVVIKNILVDLSVGKPTDVAGNFAISVAEIFDAHLSAVAVAVEPPIGRALSPMAVASIFENYRCEGLAAAESAKKAFQERARIAGISAEANILSATPADAAAHFGETARDYDLSIIAQARLDLDIPETLAIESALFQSGRPVLVVPYIHTNRIKLDRVMVCWDGGQNAARAVGDALPFLQRAGVVQVVTVEPRDRPNRLEGAMIAENLARHGIKVELTPIVAPGIDVADAILSHAADTSADLIVMGGYGHSRLREFILGGATNGMLQSMTVPTLMAH